MSALLWQNNNNNIAAFIMRTYPSSEDVQGATYYYYPSRWIQFQDRTYSAQFPLPREHSLPSCHIVALKANAYTAYPLHPTGYPLIHLGGEQQCGLKCLAEGQKVLGIDGNRTRNPLIQSQGFTPIYHGTSKGSKWQSDISRKRAKCVCHFHWRQWSTMMSDTLT